MVVFFPLSFYFSCEALLLFSTLCSSFKSAGLVQQSAQQQAQQKTQNTRARPLAAASTHIWSFFFTRLKNTLLLSSVEKVSYLWEVNVLALLSLNFFFCLDVNVSFS